MLMCLLLSIKVMTPQPPSIATASSSISAAASFPINVLSTQEGATGIGLHIFNPSKEKKN